LGEAAYIKVIWGFSYAYIMPELSIFLKASRCSIFTGSSKGTMLDIRKGVSGFSGQLAE
jgi:hypothetical protein